MPPIVTRVHVTVSWGVMDTAHRKHQGYWKSASSASSASAKYTALENSMTLMKREKDRAALAPHTSLEVLAQDLQALRVAGSLKDPKYPYQPDDSEDGSEVACSPFWLPSCSAISVPRI